MTEMPWSCAFLITVAADGLSRLTIISTDAPALIIWSAIVANFALSPFASWMTDSTPAASNASPRYLRSAVSQRAEDAASGRITPTLPAASSAAAPPPPPPPSSSSPPQPATASIAAAAAAQSQVAPRLMLPPQGWLCMTFSRRNLRLARDEGQRPQHLGALTEHAGHDLRDIGRGGQRPAAHGLPHAVEQQVAGSGQIAAHDEPLGVEDVAQQRRGAADRATGVGDDPAAAEVAVGGQAEHLGQRQLAV